MIPALYQPASLIPLEIWKASPSTTNGNEQAHRNINRDGVNLSVLGAIMRGMQYDRRAEASLGLHESHGIYTRDQLATHFYRMARSVNRHGLSNSFTIVKLSLNLTSFQCMFNAAQFQKKILNVPVQAKEIKRHKMLS